MGNVGNAKPIGKKEVDPIKQMLDGLDKVEQKQKSMNGKARDSIRDLSKLATTELLKLTEQLNKMGKTLDNVPSSINGIFSGGSSAVSHIRDELDELDSQVDRMAEKEKKWQKELDSARTKAGKERVNQRIGLEKQLEQLKSEMRGKMADPEQVVTDADKKAYSEQVKNLTKQISNIEEQKLPLMERTADKAVSVVEQVANTVLKYFTDNLAKGISDAVNWNIQNYTELAGKTGSAGETIESIKELTSEYKKSGYGSAVNINNELKPMFLELARQGLQGENLRETAITNAVDKKIMPWLENTSQYWITLSDNLGADAMNIIKGQQLYLRGSESGNRLLQTGVINQLTQQMTPLLESIKDDVFATTHTEEIYQLAQGLVEYGGYSPEEAQQMASKYIEMQKNPYQAVSSGDVSTTLMALSYARGDNALETFRQLGDIASRGQSSNIFASSAYAGTFAPFLPTQTREGLKQFSDATSQFDKISKHTDNSNKYLKEIRDNTKNYVSKADRLENTMQNGLTGIGDTFSGMYSGKLLSNATTTLLSGITATGIFKLGKSAFKKLWHSGTDMPNMPENIVSGLESKSTGFGNVGSFANTTASGGGGGTGGTSLLGRAGGLLTKEVSIGKLTTSTGGLMGGATALALGISDVTQGKEKYGDKGGALVRDAFFGTEKSGSNTLKQMAKYAGAGALIGSIIPGAGTAVGTVVGGAVGAIGGLVAGQFAKEREATQAQVEQMSQSSLGDTQTLVTILTTINENLISGKTKVTVSNVSTDPFVKAGFENVNAPKDVLKKSDNKLEDDGTYRQELLEKIGVVGKEIVEAIYGSNKPSNVKENYSLFAGMSISEDTAKIAGMGSTTGTSTSDSGKKK